MATKLGEIKAEVKSAAYLQSWSQDKFSTIQFNVQKRTPLDEVKGGYRGKPRRAAQVCVFAVLVEKDKQKVDPLNLDQWQFFVLPTRTLDLRKRSQHSITLSSLQELAEAVPYSRLRASVLEAGAKRGRRRTNTCSKRPT